ncbi:MAG: hypothetical protein GEU93_12010 [Propionibacteriales bacterium]|nr:hypothetical protein [Propionibacteriales bacterium]
MSAGEQSSSRAFVLCVGVSAAQREAIAHALGDDVGLVVARDAASAQAALRAAAGEAPPNIRPVPSPLPEDLILDRGPLYIDLGRREARWEGVPLSMPALSLDLLAALAENPGKAWTFAALTQQVWNRPFLGDTEAVVSAVKRLRRQLAEQAPGLQIDSVRGIGFRLEGLDTPDVELPRQRTERLGFARPVTS